MKRRFRWIIVSFLIAIVILLSGPRPVLPFYLGGIQVNEPDVKTWTQALKTAGMNTVEVTVYATQEEWNTDHLRFAAKNEGVVQEIRAAKAAGLKVVLILRIGLDHAYPENQFLWHGLIMPRTDEQLAQWFKKYTDFVNQWADIAEAEGVEVLGIGSEMSALTSTLPVTTLPDLERYYLDSLEQRALIHNVLEYKEQIPLSELTLSNGYQFQTLEEFLEQRLQAWQAWAKQVSYQTSENMIPKGQPTAIAAINRRRRTLDQHWRQLIHQTRQVYTGKLTYAANFDQYQSVGFWDDLDLIGINAYFPLRTHVTQGNQQQLKKQLEVGWQKVLGDVESFRRTQSISDKGVLFTELGYTRWDQNTLKPWQYSGFSLVGQPGQQQVILWNLQPTNGQERVLAVEALYKTVKAKYADLLQGILYWKISTQPQHESIEPFALILNDNPPDPIQKILRKFLPK